MLPLACCARTVGAVSGGGAFGGRGGAPFGAWALAALTANAKMAAVTNRIRMSFTPPVVDQLQAGYHTTTDAHSHPWRRRDRQRLRRPAVKTSRRHADRRGKARRG